MGIMHVVFVCHAETDWWDSGWTSLRMGFPVMTKLFEKAEERTGQRVPVTYCLTPAAAVENTDTFRQLYIEGNEIGVQVDRDYLRGIEGFLCEVGTWDDVVFATAYEAATSWKRHHV